MFNVYGNSHSPRVNNVSGSGIRDCFWILKTHTQS